MKMTWMMTVDFHALGETGSLLSGRFLLPLLLTQQRIKSLEPRRVKNWCQGQTYRSHLRLLQHFSFGGHDGGGSVFQHRCRIDGRGCVCVAVTV